MPKAIFVLVWISLLATTSSAHADVLLMQHTTHKLSVGRYSWKSTLSKFKPNPFVWPALRKPLLPSKLCLTVGKSLNIDLALAIDHHTRRRTQCAPACAFGLLVSAVRRTTAPGFHRVKNQRSINLDPVPGLQPCILMAALPKNTHS